MPLAEINPGGYHSIGNSEKYAAAPCLSTLLDIYRCLYGHLMEGKYLNSCADPAKIVPTGAFLSRVDLWQRSVG